MKRLWNIFKIFCGLKVEEIGQMFLEEVDDYWIFVVIIFVIFPFFAIIFPAFIAVVFNFLQFYPLQVTEINYLYYLMFSCFSGVLLIPLVGFFMVTIYPFCRWIHSNWKMATWKYDNRNCN